MRILRTIPAVLSGLVLGAHFLRGGNVLLVGACLAVALLALVPRSAARTVVRVALLLGVVEWLRTAYRLTEMRMALGESYGRMLVILLGVAAFAAWAAWLLPRPGVPEASSPSGSS